MIRWSGYNPPDDTWVSFSTNPRGYKMMPHFQIGLFGDHAFCMYSEDVEAVMDEGPFGLQLICERLDITNLADVEVAAADDYSTMSGIYLIIM